MPLDIDIRQDEYHISVQFSKVIELVAAVHMLSDKAHYDFDPAWFKHVMESLSTKSMELLKEFSKLNYPGVEILNFIILDKVYEDVPSFLERLRQYESLDFLYTLLEKKISKEQLQLARKDKTILNSIQDQIPWALKGSESLTEYMFTNTEAYRDNIVQLLMDIYNAGFENKLAELQEKYSSAMDVISYRLKGRNPVELAEEIKGSKFGAKNNFKEYVFAPSYFLHYHNIIPYSENTFLMIFNINISNGFDDGAAERLSELLKVLSDKTRLEILRQLKTRPTYGKVLSSRLKLTTATISRHLDQLKAINLITEEKESNVKYYHVNSDEVERLFDEIRDFINKR